MQALESSKKCGFCQLSYDKYTPLEACSGCEKVWYCKSSHCQRSDWPYHRLSCNVVKNKSAAEEAGGITGRDGLSVAYASDALAAEVSADAGVVGSAAGGDELEMGSKDGFGTVADGAPANTGFFKRCCGVCGNCPGFWVGQRVVRKESATGNLLA